MLSIKNVSKIYKTKGGVTTKALDNVSIDFPAKGMIFLLGKSGSGKSTLLNIIGGLDKPDFGEVIIKGKSSKIFSTTDFDSYRNTFIGFIFQEYNILNEFNVEQNIGLALQLQGKKADKQKIEQILEQVDLKGVAKRKPNTLSGGQKQRIAIARALIKEPQIIMADEPTGALDSNTGKQVFDTLKKLSNEKLVIVVSHDREFAKQYGDRIVELKDGKVISDETKEYLEAKKKNSNYTIGDNGVIQINNGSKLTTTDLKVITNEIKKSKGEIIISNSKENNEDIRRALKIRDDGLSEVFNTTKKVEQEKYEGYKTTFIKSRMPITRAFKMGASSLKTKPIRLAFTILLSSISFAMFGIVSTFMMYNPKYTVKEALKETNYISESMIKTYALESKSINYMYQSGKKSEQDKRTTSKTTFFGVNEFNEFNSKNDNRFAGAFVLNSNTGNNECKIESLSPASFPYYNKDTFVNFSDCGKDYMDKNFVCLAGSYPTSTNEIAISNYIADVIISDASQGIQAGDYAALVNQKKKYNISGYCNYGQFKKEISITGIYKISDIPDKYNDLKKERTSNYTETEWAALGTDFKNYISTGFFLTAFVNSDFYSENKAAFQPIENNNSSSMPNIGNLLGFMISSSKISNEISGTTSYTSIIDKELLDEVEYQMEYYNTKGEKVDTLDLKSREIILPLYNYYQLVKDNEGAVGKLSVFYNKLGFGSNSDASFASPFYYKLNDNIKSEIDSNKEKYTKAVSRIRNYCSNYSSTYYEGGENQYKADIELLTNCFVNNYKDLYEKIYVYDLICIYANRNVSISAADSDAKDRINSYLSNQDSEYETEHTLTEDLETLEALLTSKKDTEDLTRSIYCLLGELLIQRSSSNRLTALYSDDFVVGILSHINSSETLDPEKLEKYKNIMSENFEECLGFAPNYELNYSLFGDKPNLDSNKSKMFYKDSKNKSGTYEIKGYYKQSNSGTYIVPRNDIKDYINENTSIYVEVSKTNYSTPSDVKYNTLITKTDFSEKDINVMLQSFDTYDYELSNPVYTSVKSIINLVSEFKTIFFYVGLATGLMAALLMVNFISVSISTKKKDIGILRAVGAKGGDVFKIFYSESSVIAMICFLISSIGSAIACYFLNKTIGSSLVAIVGGSTAVSIINFGLINILIILGASILITFLATFIPVMIASKKPPVESIRAL